MTLDEALVILPFEQRNNSNYLTLEEGNYPYAFVDRLSKEIIFDGVLTQERIRALDVISEAFFTGNHDERWTK